MKSNEEKFYSNWHQRIALPAYVTMLFWEGNTTINQDWESNNDQTYIMSERVAFLGIMGAELRPSWNLFDHHNAIVLRRLRGTLNWATIILRDVSL